jgi:Asp-tRNA(Asn)/Glu-tRNA(Gln) amidotransferase A subunit family amidase
MTGLEALEMRFAVHEGDVHAFVDEPDRFARLRRELAEVDEQTRSGVVRPLAGLPLGVKDIFHVDGLPTRAGSKLPAEELAGPEAQVVSALRAAGAIVVGKTNTTEFAYLEPGPTRNPHALDRTPGGSSSGSAAGVAAGLCDLALGTQTIGSIGRPAAYCGVVGFKPSYDRISRAGVIPLAPSVDHVGLFAADVATVERALTVVIPDWSPVEEAGDSAGSPAENQRRLGIPVGSYLRRAANDGRGHFASVCAKLEDRGYKIVEVNVMDDFDEIDQRHRLLVAAEAAEVHRDWFARFGELYRPKTAELIRRGQGIGAEELANARAGRGALRDALHQAMDLHQLDLWISPPAPGAAPHGLDSTGDPVMNLPWTHAGLPTLVLPAGQNAEGAPMGLQLAARFGRDEALVALGAAVEAALRRRASGAPT